MAEWLRWVTTDLLANGCRRIGHHQFEDAILRAYRVLELIGQFRLFANGYDSACLDPEDTEVEKFRKYFKKKNSEDFGAGKKDGREVLTASKMLVARFLKHLGDPFGEKLVKFDNDDTSEVKASHRNLSILIHGFSVADLDEKSPSDLYKRIKALLDEDWPHEMHGINPDRFGIVP